MELSFGFGSWAGAAAVWQFLGNISRVEWLCSKVGVQLPIGGGPVPVVLKWALIVGLAFVGFWRLRKAVAWKHCAPAIQRACLSPSKDNRVLSVRVTLTGSSSLYSRWDLLAFRYRLCVLPSAPESPERFGNTALPWFVKGSQNGDIAVELQWTLSVEEWQFLQNRKGQQMALREATFETNHGRFSGHDDGAALEVGHIGEWPHATP
jgi:hypothetical protein